MRLATDRAIIGVGGKTRRMFDNGTEIGGVTTLEGGCFNVKMADSGTEVFVGEDGSSESFCLCSAGDPDGFIEQILSDGMPLLANSAYGGLAVERPAVGGETAEEIGVGVGHVEKRDRGIEVAVRADEVGEVLDSKAQDGDPYFSGQKG